MTQYDIIYGKKRKGEITSPAKLFFTSCLAICVAAPAMAGGGNGPGDYKGPYYVGYLCPNGTEPDTHNVAHILMDWANYVSMPSMGFDYAPAYFDISACGGSAACAYMNVNWLWINQTSSLPVPDTAYTTVPSYMKSNTPYYGPWDDMVDFQSLLNQLDCDDYTCDSLVYGDGNGCPSDDQECCEGDGNCCIFDSGDPNTECCTGGVASSGGSGTCRCNPYIEPNCYAFGSLGGEKGSGGFDAWNSLKSCLESDSEANPGWANDSDGTRKGFFETFLKESGIDGTNLDPMDGSRVDWAALWDHDDVHYHNGVGEVPIKHVCYSPFLQDAESGDKVAFNKYDQKNKATQTFTTPRVSGPDGVCRGSADVCFVEPYRWRCGIFLPYAEPGEGHPTLLGVIDLQENSEYANIVFIPNSAFDFGSSHTGHYWADWSTAAPYAYSSWPYNHDSTAPYYNGYHAYGPNSADYSSEAWENVLNKTGGYGLTRYSLICVPTRYEFPKMPVYWKGFGNPVPTLYTTYTIQNGEIPDPIDYNVPNPASSVVTPSGYQFTGWQN